MGMLLPDETYEERSSSSPSSYQNDLIFSGVNEAVAAKALSAFRKCDDFLQRYNIRPEFFCRHQERIALQSWLLQRTSTKFDSGKFCGN